MRDAALVCHQLGLVLNPNDWFLMGADIPVAGTREKILLSNVQCTEEDVDITECRAERANDMEKSCSHDHDVGLRCYEPHWAGVRLGVLAEKCIFSISPSNAPACWITLLIRSNQVT
ncbi:protein bark beetle-like [Nilaparvata lugens]|uniref:protein bark beetle-like n=1 Tax=Nilaparvata lugens TaxID=108931 RepID=UPI00193D0577|nr:protein bark beetle-like [Nilaparvata lugens]